MFNWGIPCLDFKVDKCKNALDLIACIGFYCTCLPFAKTGEKLLGTIILDADAKIIKNVAKGRNFRKLLEKRGRQRGLELLNKAKTQIGSGQNRTK